MSQLPIAYPAFLDLRHRLVIVIGEGPVAERRARNMLRYGADVVVIGATPTPALIEAEAEGLLTLERRSYEPGDMTGAILVMCVEPDEAVRRAVFSEAEERGCLVSTTDVPDESNFSTPSVVRRGALQIAISTAGRVPEVARQVRGILKEQFGEEWADYVSLMADLRELVAERLPEEDRAAVLDGVAASEVLERIRDGNAPDAEGLLREFESRRQESTDAGSIESADAAAEPGSVESSEEAHE